MKELQAKIKEVETTLSELPEAERGPILEELDSMNRSADRILQHRKICKIAVRAHELYVEMPASFELGPEHCDLSHAVFTRGTNKTNAIRLLVSVNCAVEIFATSLPKRMLLVAARHGSVKCKFGLPSFLFCACAKILQRLNYFTTET